MPKGNNKKNYSTYIKEELRKGNMELVDKLLGYSYQEHKK